MHRSRIAMGKKHWFSAKLLEQAKNESETELAKKMRRISFSLTACGSRTLWAVAIQGYLARCKKAKDKGEDWRQYQVPAVEESIEWQGEVGGEEGVLKTTGLARCERMQCPICCNQISSLRRKLALDWAKDKNWSEYYVVALTFTVPHQLSDSETSRRFKKIMDNLGKSASDFSSWVRNIRKADVGNGFRSSCPESLGFISSLEVTFGENGLHPHFHSLFFTKSKDDVDALKKWFRRDRVRVWRTGNALKRMPDVNEELGFKLLVEPFGIGKANLEVILSYLNKGLFETLSVATKDKAKGKSKTIFQLSGPELKYFCTFFEATKGKRFYRSGGICKEIKKIKDIELDKESAENRVDQLLHRLFKISQKDSNLPHNWVSEFVQKHQSELEKKSHKLSSSNVKKLVSESWNCFFNAKLKVLQNSRDAFSA